MSVARLLRACALTVLAVMLLLRVGPICEVAAQAATSHAAASSAVSGTMAGCERPPGKPAGKTSLPTCLGGCIAVDPPPVATAAMAPVARERPASRGDPELEGRSAGPVLPPPRTM